MATITARYLCEDRYQLATRGHVVHLDQPRADHVELGPTPVELFVMAMAGCVAHYAVDYLRRHGASHANLRVDAEWTMRGNPARVGRVRLAISPPIGLAQEHYDGMVEAARHCTVHNTLREPPVIEVLAGVAAHAGQG